MTVVNCLILGPRRMGMSTDMIGIKLIDKCQFYSEDLQGVDKTMRISMDKGYL